MPYEEDYKMWLEEALIRMNPDWVCDEMSENEFTHNWCHQYCGEDDAYITPKCLHMYYHHIARADRKTEPQTETKTETQNSNLTFEKDECAKEYEELGLKELKELIEADRKTENSSEKPNSSKVSEKPTGSERSSE